MAEPDDCCATCRYFLSDLDTMAGVCRRQPPVVYAHGVGDTFGYWPPVLEDDWCGEYQPRHPAAEQP